MNPASMLAQNPLPISMNQERCLMPLSRHHSLRYCSTFVRWYIISVFGRQSLLLTLPWFFCAITQVEDPTFSLGVTQEDSHGTFVIANSGVTCSLGTISTHILTRGERVKEPASNRRFSKIFSATRTLVSHM